MKTIFRVSVFGLMTAAFMAVSAVSTFAQNPCDDSYETQQAIYQKFRDGRKEPRAIEKAKVGITSGEEFVSKYGTCEPAKAVVDFINKNLPELKEWVKLQELYTRFNTSIKDVKNVNVDEAYASGKEIMSLKPELAFDIQIVLASVGFDNSIKTPPVDKFNAEAISYAKKAISDIEAGKTSSNYGALTHSFAIKNGQTVDQAKSKQNALGWLNYMIGTIMYYNQKATKDAVPYYYKATKFESPTKKKPDVYRAVGAWYLEEILKMNQQREEKIKANEGKDNEETVAMLALIKGYADRAIDAYARAYSISPTSETVSRKAIYEKLQSLYEIRFGNKNGIDAYVSTVASKPMPDPTTTVEPIKEDVPATTTTTTTSSTTTNPSTTPATTTTKPVTTTNPSTTKPTTDTTKPVTDTTKPTTGKTSKTKTTTKKKGTR